MSVRPIGVFDSGVGGLTVLRALRERLPEESFVYLGDTARLPYGTKSPETVRRYALQAAGKLVERGVKMLVIACNTASAVGLDRLQDRFAPLPVLGVVEPGAAAACEAARGGGILVLGTESTIAGGAYQRAILRLRPDAEIQTRACPLFVALAEEGWVTGGVVEEVCRRYLDPYLRLVQTGDKLGARAGSSAPDCIVLGCTHFPVLRGAIQRVSGAAITLVDSAQTTAVAVAESLGRVNLRASSTGGTSASSGTVTFLATDAPDRFARVGPLFLGASIDREEVELVDL